MVGFRLLALIAGLLVLVLPEAASAGTQERFLVQRDAGLSAAERADIRSDAGVRLVESEPAARAEIVSAPAARADEALAALRRDPDVTLAVPEPVFELAGPDPDLVWQWALENTGGYLGGTVDADLDGIEAWGQATGFEQTVAVVDSGVDLDHNDLDANILGGGHDYIDGGTPQDAHGHGTHVSGIIAALHDNDRGVSGLAYDAKILPYRVFQGQTGSFSDVVDAFDRAGNADVRVVNASLGTRPLNLSDANDRALSEAISDWLEETFEDHPETLYVVAAGNEDNDNDVMPVYPCNTPADNVVCVGATDADDQVAGFSNVGDVNVDLFAPGVDIYSTVIDSYGLMDGTSMATPQVSAIAALVLQAEPGISTLRLKQAILASADPIPDAAGKSLYPARANANNALLWLAADTDSDTFANADDNCWSVAGAQTDTDSDAYGDVCDADDDGDGVPDTTDGCDTDRGAAADGGCPVVSPPAGPNPTPTPTPTPTPPADRDGDGRYDATDACPTEHARTTDGCPLPQVASLSARSRKGTATIKVTTSRVAAVRITVERKKGRRWTRVARKSVLTSGNRASLTVKRLKAGSYRVRISISSSAGSGTPKSKSFRVR